MRRSASVLIAPSEIGGERRGMRACPIGGTRMGTVTRLR